MDMDTSDAMDFATPSFSPFSSSPPPTSSSSSTSSSSGHCPDQTTATVTPSQNPSPFPSSSSSSLASSPPTITTPAEAALARHSALLAQLRRRRHHNAGRDGTLGTSETWPPHGLFPGVGTPDRDEVEAWLRRQLLEVVRQKSARWGIDFASDPIERIASVVLAEEGFATEELELVPPPQPTGHSNLGVDASSPTQSSSSSSYSTTPTSTSSSSSSSATTPSSGFEHASVYEVRRTGAKRPPH